MDRTKRRKALQKPIYNKKTFCGVSPNDMVRFGAKQWNQLTLKEKDFFKNMVSIGNILVITDI